MKDAQALAGEEGRDKLRKAAVSGKYTLTRRYPNGATHLLTQVPRKTWGKPGELKHLTSRRKRKQK